MISINISPFLIHLHLELVLQTLREVMVVLLAIEDHPEHPLSLLALQELHSWIITLSPE